MRWDATQRASGTYSVVRGHGRLPVEIGVTCEHKPGRPIRGLVRDLSLTGLCIESFDLPEFGESLVVRMRLPGAIANSGFHATVRWARRGQFGVELNGLTALERTELARVVRQLLCAS